jgi:acetate kinase
VTDRPSLNILTVNSGSSSLKLALYRMGAAEVLELSGRIERIGLRGSRFRIEDASGAPLVEDSLDLPDHDAALQRLFQWLEGHASDKGLDAVGHRVVHGGARYDRPHVITTELVAALADLVPLAPDHLPHELRAIRSFGRSYPHLKQVACFDTAFHRQMPEVAQMYPLPRYLWHAGAIRYGFHGLSYEYIMQELKREAGSKVADGRVVIAHLGNGASMVAVRNGQSLDTTMGLTPTGGLMMGTRSGDIDPGVILFLLQEQGMKASTVSDLVNEHAGLVGVSGISSDMRDLLRKEAENAHAAQAVALFCYQAKKYLGALTAVLGGLDTLIFTAGIGENAPTVRQRICQGLDYLGIWLDDGRNAANAPIISRVDSPVTVRIMRTDEELMIARHTRDAVADTFSGKDSEE